MSETDRAHGDAMTARDIRFMQMALSLGRRGLGTVWPNPAVGCVIVQGARVVGRGWTAPGGRPHAETQALAQAGEAARGATAYVTLEPCAHHGQTPPCAQALIAAGIARVVCALGDPDPRVSGAGFRMLEDAGICVTREVCAAAARSDQAGFLSRVMTGRPILTLKLATSLDGRIATASGDSQWITGPLARRIVHAQRASHDAVLVGAGTAREDDPSLTVRGLGMGHQPVRVVLSTKLDLPVDGTLARTAADMPVWLLHGPDAPEATCAAWRDRGARLIALPRGDGGRPSLAGALQALGQHGLTRVYCEGGGQLAASLLEADLVDHLILFTGGKAIGAEGRPALGSLGLSRLSEAPRFALQDTRVLDGDVMQRWRRCPRPDDC